MATYEQALTALIDQEYGHTLQYTRDFGRGPFETRDVVAVNRENMRIADELFGPSGVGDAFYQDVAVDFGVFDNLREYGLTVTIGGWTFCAYEHRNSDNICVEGCPNDQVQEYGPYGGEDKFDTLFSTGRRQYEKARDALVVAMQAVQSNPRSMTREALKKIMREFQ